MWGSHKEVTPSE
jgi:hypothetical protein